MIQRRVLDRNFGIHVFAILDQRRHVVQAERMVFAAPAGFAMALNPSNPPR
jgi:hypothetical protein